MGVAGIASDGGVQLENASLNVSSNPGGLAEALVHLDVHIGVESTFLVARRMPMTKKYMPAEARGVRRRAGEPLLPGLPPEGVPSSVGGPARQF